MAVGVVFLNFGHEHLADDVLGAADSAQVRGVGFVVIGLDLRPLEAECIDAVGNDFEGIRALRAPDGEGFGLGCCEGVRAGL